MNRIAMICFILEALLLPTAFASFPDIGVGARPVALGGAYVAMGNDSLSLMVNPAGLAWLQQPEITTEYAQLFAGLSDNSSIGQTYFGYGQPLGYRGGVAFGWKQLSLDRLYTERTLSLGYAYRLTAHLSIGGTIKQLYHSFGAPDTVVDDAGQIRPGTPTLFTQYGQSGSAYTGDVGILYRVAKRNIVGLSVQNVTQPDVALSPHDYDPVTPTTRAGWQYHSPSRLHVAAALVTRENLEHQRDYQGGVATEKWWGLKNRGDISARGSFFIGSRDYRQFALGAGWQLAQFQIDYAFVFNLGGLALGTTAGSHRFSLGYRFGSGKPSTESLSTPSVGLDIVDTLLALEKPERMFYVCSPEELGGTSREGTPNVSSHAALMHLLEQYEGQLARYHKLVHINAPLRERAAALEALLVDIRAYLQCATPDLLVNADEIDALEKASDEYAASRKRSASYEHNQKMLVGILATYLENALMSRQWNLKDLDEREYRHWINKAWDAHRVLLQKNASLNSRIETLERITKKAIRSERSLSTRYPLKEGDSMPASLLINR